MQIYWLFGGEAYYPGGGMNDFILRFEQLDDAVAFAKEKRLDWWHVLNIDLGMIVRWSDQEPFGQKDSPNRKFFN